MDALHIVKVGEHYIVYYNKRETEFASLEDASNDNIYSRALKDYIFEIFRVPRIKRFSVERFGDWWWAEAETTEGLVFEEEGYRPHSAAADLLLSIERNTT